MLTPDITATTTSTEEAPLEVKEWVLVIEKRKSLQKSQVEVARDCSVTQKTVSHWENLEDIPKPANLRALANSLGIPFEELRRSAASIFFEQKYS